MKPISKFCYPYFCALLFIASVSNAIANDADLSQLLNNNTTTLPSSPIDTGTNTCPAPDTASCTPGGEQDVGASNNDYQPLSQVGNPVSLITGNKYQKESDYSSPASKLQLLRHYNSANTDFNYGLGRGWSSTYATRLIKLGKSGFDLVESTGKAIHFSENKLDDNGAETWHSINPAQGYLRSDEKHYYWELPDGRSLTFFGRFPVRIDFAGHSYLKLFYKNRKLIEVSDEAGRVIKLGYYPGRIGLPSFNESRFSEQPGHLAKITLPSGQEINYDYDNQLNLTRVRYDDGTSREFHYEDDAYPNHLTGITDRSAIRYASWRYNDAGKAISSKHANGVERVTLDYFLPEEGDSIGATLVTSSQGEVTHYSWQLLQAVGQALLLSSDGPGCATCPRTGMRYTYNQRYQVETATHESGVQTRYVYDEQGRLVDVYTSKPASAEVHEVHNTYEGDSSFVSMVSKPSVNPEGRHVVKFEYSKDKQPLRIVESGFAPVGDSENHFEVLERTTTLEYQNGRLSLIDGPRTDVQDLTQFEYDELGRMNKVSLPTGRVITLSNFDADGRAREYRTGSKTPMHLTYDDNGNVIEARMRGERIQYRYDAESRLIGMINPYGKSVELNYDEAGRLTKLTDDMGLISEFISDSEGRVTDKSFYGINGELIRSLSYVFDAEGRLIAANEQSSNDSTGTVNNEDTDFYYDAFGQLVSLNDSETGDQTDIAYDPFGRLKSITDVVSSSTNAVFDYDNKGQHIGFTDARRNQTKFLKDDFGRVVALMSPDTGTTLYQYDNAGNRTRKLTASGDEFIYKWDAGERLVREQSPDGVTSYKYHATNGRLIETANPDTSEYFAYNSDSQLIEHARDLDGNRLTTGYRYDERGRLHKKLLPDGQALRYHYHESGVNVGSLRAITRETLLGLSQETLAAEIDTEFRDGVTGFLSHNGVRTERRYFPNGDINSIDVSNTMSLQYRFDSDGNITGIDQDSITQSFLYNNDSLIQASTLLGDFRYTYDSVANRTQSNEVLNDGSVNQTRYSYAAEGQGNRLLATTNDITGEVSQYDYNEAGSPILRGADFRYEYNAKQRPIAVYKQNELIAEYRYNSFGERIKKVVYNNNATTVTYYLYDGHTLTAEVSANGNVNAQYVYLLNDKLIAKLENKQVYAIHTDHLGTPRRMTDAQAQLVWDADYTPFGQASIGLETVQLNMRLPGQYEDAETGTHYNYYRDYDPSTGRYITSDPIGLKGGVNSYAYLAGNPINGTDVLGLSENSPNLQLEDGTVKPIASASFMEKTDFVFGYLDDYFVHLGSDALKQLFTAENLGLMVGMVGAIAALQLVPGLNVVVDALLLGWAWWEFGSAGWNLIKTLISSIGDINSATTAKALCNASKNLADALIQILGALPPAKLSKLTKFLDKGKKRATGEANKHGLDAENPKTNCGNLRSRCPTTNPLNIPKTDASTDYYTVTANTITGKRANGKTYTKTTHTHRDSETDQIYETWQSGGEYWIFKDGKRQQIKNPDPSKIRNHYVGLIGEIQTSKKMDQLGYEPVAGTKTVSKNGQANADAVESYMGTNGIDGIYKDPKTGDYVIVESKASSGSSTGSLNNTNDGQQLSKDWLVSRVNQLDISEAEKSAILDQINDGSITLLKANIKNVDAGDVSVNPNPTVNGDVTFKKVEFAKGDNGTTDPRKVKIGSDWP